MHLQLVDAIDSRRVVQQDLSSSFSHAKRASPLKPSRSGRSSAIGETRGKQQILCYQTSLEAKEGEHPKITILGSGIFVRTQYIPRLKEITDLVVVKTIWSRTEDSAKAAAELAPDFSPNIKFKWGEAELDDIIQDDSIQ